VSRHDCSVPVRSLEREDSDPELILACGGVVLAGEGWRCLRGISERCELAGVSFAAAELP
jgi:hypothetical protein